MDGPWDPSLMTGDQCAFCEAPLDDPAFEIEGEDGELLRVCSTCALQRPDAAREDDARTEGTGPASPSLTSDKVERIRAWVTGLVDSRAQEATGLRGLVDVLQKLQEDAEHWRSVADDLEHRLKVMEGDVLRTRERLRKAEDLLGWTGGEHPAVSAEQPVTGSPDPAAAGGLGAAPAPSPVTPSAVVLPPGTPEEQRAHEEHVARHFPSPPEELTVEPWRFTVDELRQVQRYFNESPFTEKTRSVRRGLGAPIVNLMRVVGPGVRVLVTVAWDIVWYQYLIRLEEDTEGEPRVELFAEGMELHELADSFKASNAGMDDRGCIDASELEVELLTDQPLLTDMTAEEEAAIDDATEEIWDRHKLPEFRWDD